MVQISIGKTHIPVNDLNAYSSIPSTATLNMPCPRKTNKHRTHKSQILSQILWILILILLSLCLRIQGCHRDPEIIIHQVTKLGKSLLGKSPLKIPFLLQKSHAPIFTIQIPFTIKCLMMPTMVSHAWVFSPIHSNPDRSVEGVLGPTGYHASARGPHANWGGLVEHVMEK